MGGKVSPFVPACNGSVHVELSDQSTSSDAGALVLREALDASQLMAWLDRHLSVPACRSVSSIPWSISCAPCSSNAPWAGLT